MSDPRKHVDLERGKLLIWSNIALRIINRLCERDSRFRFIQESIKEFYHDMHGTFISLKDLQQHNGGPHHQNTDPTTLQHWGERLQDHRNDLAWILYEIVDAAIYEIIDAFNINLTTEQLPGKFSVNEYVYVLQILYDQSRDLQLVPVGCAPAKNLPDRAPERCAYQYSDSLVSLSETSSSTKIRVLHLLPGFEQSRIDCHLEVRDIYADDIDEALSYVWGERYDLKSIWVDGQPFPVTKNLYEILITLRRPEATRIIWIDAICINQSDLDEKTHQVRHMGEIYSKAKETVIWLSGQMPDVPMNQPDDILDSLPLNCRGNRVDQYDLRSILAEVRKLSLEIPWNKEHVVLGTMLTHCLNTIMSHEWWKRVWTIQEAVLPREHPIIMFRGYEFSFGDFISAIQAMRSLQSILPSIRSMPEKFLAKLQDGRTPGKSKDAWFLSYALPVQIFHWDRNNESHALRHFRPGQEHQGQTGSIRKDLHSLLCETGHYMATDPRDKYFAMQSLLPNSKGRLIYANYNESKEAIFTRATARCYNESDQMHMTTNFRLLIESQTNAGVDTSYPSWAQDFTYSDSRYHQSDNGDAVTFNGYLYEERNWHPKYEAHMPGPCFATPSTLFCSGLKIDVVCTTGVIPDPPEETCKETWVTFMPNFFGDLHFHDGRTYWDRLYRHESNKLLIEALAIRARIARLKGHMGNHSSHNSPPEFPLSTAVMRSIVERGLQLTTKQIPNVDINDLFTLGGRPSIETELASKDDRLERRVRELSGKQYFTTDQGLVGIATAPIAEGDILAVTHASPAYLIIREVKSSDEPPEVVQKHRIVARAVISEKKNRMAERLAGLKVHLFQII
ncbi:heterokaryon incompatibility protein-domain-containing protein [Xylariaceae sp. AK1471]|nr:heterokaryon incompatibility protein-domain-containing protein [Xylariaceae sp. AK1471]